MVEVTLSLGCDVVFCEPDAGVLVFVGGKVVSMLGAPLAH